MRGKVLARFVLYRYGKSRQFRYFYVLGITSDRFLFQAERLSNLRPSATDYRSSFKKEGEGRRHFKRTMILYRYRLYIIWLGIIVVVVALPYNYAWESYSLCWAPALLLPLSLKLLLPSWDRTSAEYIPITMTITIMNHPPRVPNNDHTEVGSCNSLLPAFSFLPFANSVPPLHGGSNLRARDLMMLLRTATLTILTLGASPVGASPVIDGLTSTVIFKLLTSQSDHESAAASVAAQAGLTTPRRSECILTSSIISHSHSFSFSASHSFRCHSLLPLPPNAQPFDLPA